MFVNKVLTCSSLQADNGTNKVNTQKHSVECVQGQEIPVRDAPGRLYRETMCGSRFPGGWEHTRAVEDLCGTPELCFHVTVFQYITLPSTKIDITI